MQERHKQHGKIFVESLGDSIQRPILRAGKTRKEPIAHHLPAAIPFKFRTMIDAHKLLALMLIEELMNVILRFNRQILSTQQMVVGIRSMLQSLLEKHILRLNLTQISPTHIHPLLQNKEAGLGKSQRFGTIKHIRFPVYMQKYIISLIIEHRQQYP